MNLAHAEVIPNSQSNIADLTQIRDWIFVLKIGSFIGFVMLGGRLAGHGGLALQALGILILGAVYAHAVELQHQCIHQTALKKKAMNRIIGFLLGLPMLVAYSHYRYQHLRHHRDLGTPYDQEFFNLPTNVLGFRFFVRMLKLNRFKDLIKNMFCSWSAGMVVDCDFAPAVQKKIASEYRLLSIFSLAGAALMLLYPLLVLKLWLLPLLISEFIHFLIELPEHLGCDRLSLYIRKNTRTIKGSALSFWFTNGNNFHVEHHMRPNVPIDRLPELHKQMAHQLEFYEPTYSGFYAKVLKGKFL